ncbi:uncharacterized protein LOC131627181 [Vicia villosa]|uniref:uncharacterized protein LOC131627181 n=1 Tax=Vicia villosa TaxID=3911 RepID=UPI00273A8ACE|nr:uncharacterized protein LOC131627181 [Vicia villosa]
MALLYKWRWRILQDSNYLWYSILKARYRDVNLCAANGRGNLKFLKTKLIWWSDLSSLGSKLPEEVFAWNCKFRVGDGYSTSFWHSRWLEEGILMEIFPNLFHSSFLQDVSIASMGGWRNSQWLWLDFGIQLAAALAAANDIQRLGVLLPGTVSTADTDQVKWRPTEDGLFSVLSDYTALSKRIPTKDLLATRGILPLSTNLFCVFCNEIAESSSHSLLSCRNAVVVWKQMSEWLGLDFSMAVDFKGSFSSWRSLCLRKKSKKGKAGCAWLAIVWSLWLCRNGIIFNNTEWNETDVIGGCKALLWRWSFIGKITQFNCNFYEFSKNPLLYLN